MDISKTKARIYVGPSLPKGVLARFTAFSDGVPPHVAELMEKSSALKGLLVPVARLSQARKDVETKGTLLNLYASKVRDEIKG